MERILVRTESIAARVLRFLGKAGRATFENIEDIFITSYHQRGLGDYPRRSIYNASQRLKARGYIKSQKKGGKIVFELTEAAKRQLFVFEKLSLKHSSPLRWDKRWRLVSFDIPETQKKYRDTLRWKLKRLGLEKFQQSIWLSPYPLEDDFQQIIAEGGLQNCILIIDTDRLPNEARWRQHFKLPDDSLASRPRSK